MISVESVKSIANGRWLDVYSWLGIDVPDNKRHGPCPMCGGKDRFRMDDKGGEGTWICNSCGAGDGIALVQAYNECDFLNALKKVSDSLGIQDYDQIKRDDAAKRNESRQLEQSAKLAQEKRENNAVAAIRAIDVVSRCQPADYMHPYLIKKQINALTALQCFDNVSVETKSGRMMSIKNFLVIPMHDDIGNLVNCQLISPCLKYKLFMLNGQTKGASHAIGNLVNGEPILVCEGYATGSTISDITWFPVVIAFTADNLLSVCESLNYNYPRSKIVIMGDNDWHLEDPIKYKKPQNKGKHKAAEAAAKTGSRLMFPDWARGVTDFNDQFVIYGKKIDLIKLVEMTR